MALSPKRLAKPFLYALAVWHVFLLGYNFVDIHFYADTQRHMTYDIMYAWQSLDVVLKMGLESLLAPTIGMALGLAGYGYVFHSIIRRELSRPERENPHLKSVTQIGKEACLVLLFIAITIVSIRGGFQLKPLGVRHAFTSDNEALGNLSLNGIYTSFQALYERLQSKERLDRMSDEDIAALTPAAAEIVSPDAEVIDPDYPLYRRYPKPGESRKKMNVVLFIMESWTAKFTKSLGGGISAAPYFDDLTKEGLLLDSCFANGQRTFEGVLASVGSFPTWNYMIIGKSGLTYQTRLQPAAALFKKLGYETLFIHGGKKGSMGLNKLLRRMGVDRHFSADDFKQNNMTTDHIWGIYDEYVFKRANKEFSKIDKPFFAVVLSLSSHLPFKLPSKRFEKFTDVESPMKEFLNSFGYSDYALHTFFEAAKKSDYYENTLFVITGDHVAGYFTKDSLYDAYRVPCLFINSKLGLSGVYGKTASQYDLLPTVIDLLDIQLPFTAWGKSILQGGDRTTILPRGDMQVYVKNNHMLLAGRKKIYGLYDYLANPAENLGEGGAIDARALHKSMLDYIDLSEQLILKNRVTPPIKAE